MLIKFSPEFLIYTSGLSSVKVSGSNISEALADLFSRFPQLMMFLTDNKSSEAEKTSLKLNGEYVFEESSIWTPVGDEDCLEFGRDVPEGESGGIKMMVGAFIMIAAVAMTPFTAGGSLAWTPYGMMAMGFGASLAIGGLTELIIGTPSIPGMDNSEASPTYQTFSGIQNTTAPGTPVGIVYGTHRVGGHLTSVYTRNLGDNSYLYVQIALSEGEVGEIKEVEINKRPALDYQFVSGYSRYGTHDQPPPALPLFNKQDGIEGRALIDILMLDWVNSTGWHTLPIVTSISSVAYTFTIEAVTKGARVKVTIAEDNNHSTILSQSEYIYAETMQWPDKEKFTITLGGARSANSNLAIRVDYIETVYTVAADGYQYTEYTYPHEVRLISYVTTDLADANNDNKPMMLYFGEIINSTSYNLTVRANVEGQQPSAWVATTVEATSFYVVVEAPQIIGVRQIGFQVGYREIDSMNTTPNPDYTLVLAPDKTDIHYVTTAADTTSPTYLEVEAFVPLGLYEIAIWRVDAGHEGSTTIVDNLYFTSLTTKSPGQHIYPYTALLGLKIRATDQLNGGLPTITSLVKGVKVAVPVNYDGDTRTWSGAYTHHLTYEYDPYTGIGSGTKQWTDNPVWCLYDLISNKRYGLGDYFKISTSALTAMYDNFKVAADYCDQIISTTGVVTSRASLTADQLRGLREPSSDTSYRHRFSLNVVIDESKSAIEWLNTICAIMRATLYYTEGCVYIDIDRSKNITQLFTMSSIKDYTQSRTSITAVPNVYELQFVDRTKRYEPQILMVENPVLQQGTTIERQTKTLQLRGVTDERQARSLAKYVLYAGKYCRTNVNFKTGTQGLRSMVGDIVGIQHDVPEWGVGGKITAVNGSTITISSPLVFEASALAVPYNYSIMIQRAGQAPVECGVVEQAVSATEYYTITLTSPPSGIAVGDEYIIGLITNVVKPFRIVNLKRDSDEFVELTAVEYVESLYTAADDISTVGGVTAPLYQQPDDPTQVSVTNLHMETTTYIDSTGVLRNGINVTYTVPNSTFWTGVQIQYGVDGYTTKLPVNSSGFVFIPDLKDAGLYSFVATSVYKDGTTQSIAAALADSINMPYGTLATLGTKPTAAELSSLTVNNLQLYRAPGSTVFTGKDAVFTWEPPSTALIAFGSKNWLKGYHVAIYNTTPSADLVPFGTTLGNAAWSKTGLTIIDNDISSPYGGSTAEKLVETATTGAHSITQAVTGGTLQFTASCYFKAAERTAAFIRIGNASYDLYAYFDLTNKVSTYTNYGAATVSAITTTITPTGGGYMRCSVTCTGTAAATICGFGAVMDYAAVGTARHLYAGELLKGIHAWEAKVCAGYGDMRSYRFIEYEGMFSYTYELNRFDQGAPTRSFKIEVTAEDTSHSLFQTAGLSVSNASPASIG